MSAIKGIWQNGQFVVRDHVPWPEGTEVLIEPFAKESTLGIAEEDWPTDPKEIAQMVAKMDEFEPVLSPEEEAAWQEARKAQREFELATFEQRAQQIEKLFE